MKKFLKILGVFLLAVVVLVAAAPFLFKDQIATIIKNKLNGALDAQVEFADVDLSLFRAFPDARLQIDGLSIINKAPFEGDTLFYGKEVKLDLPVGDLFNDASDPIHINELVINDATSRLKVNEDGKSSWDIAKVDSTAVVVEEPQDTTAGFSFDLNHYEINNTDFSYEDVATKNKLRLMNLTHSGNGDFSLDSSTLDTQTSAQVFYGMDDIEYLSGQQVELDADILMDLANQKYTLQENEALINDLKLNLDGYVQMVEDGTMVDLAFKTPSSDFKNFFAVIPEVYRKNLDGITTTGDFTVNGVINGMVDDVHIPKLDINISSNNASFKYPDLPQSVTKIDIDTQIKNTTGLAEDTYVKIGNVAFNIGQDRLKGNALVRNLTTNMLVDLNLDGTLNLGNLSKAFPMGDDMNLDGTLVADVSTKFDMNSVEQERYENINTKGTASLTDFNYASADLKNPLYIERADLDMNNTRIKLDNFKAKTGNTDFAANGTISNLMGFLFKDQDLKGSFKVDSNQFDTSDFMTETEVETTETNSANSAAATTEAIKIPSFLNADMSFNANKVLYDNLTLTNVKGLALVRDETLTLNNTTTDIFNGNIGLNGSVTTKGDTPLFNMALDMNDLDIAQSFEGFEMFQKLVPIIQALKGKINTEINLNGQLNNDLTPIISSLTGDAIAQLLTREIDKNKAPLIAKLDDRLNFINLDDLKLSDLVTKLNFKDGAVQITPFDFNIKDIKITASGAHSLTNDMSYKLDLNVPARYLGTDGAALLSKLSDEDIDKISVPIPVQLSGSFMKPNVDLNLDLAVKNLTNQIVEIQKARIKDKGKETLDDAVTDILGGKNPLDGIKDAITGNKKPSDTTQTQVKDSTAVTKPKDTTAIGKVKEEAEDKVKEAAGNILNNLFKKKKS
ncbi:outer membrane assembly protein [Nonlabens ulvanivorans]|uniref:Outer membrane assembly protein n=1 Tax=Nonlabens ulvanivorans TaxID=906888 RepID=A0A090Q5J1_NONUL|nr:AsmA-like C-terminal region-containing protein [Nonlabens ulvanivorans]GAK98369.1 outer membrane assembly protein [Nonlabens ulvanivorans]